MNRRCTQSTKNTEASSIAPYFCNPYSPTVSIARAMTANPTPTAVPARFMGTTVRLGVK